MKATPVSAATPSRPARALGPGKLAPRALARARQLSEAGASTRAIAKALRDERLADVHHGSVARALATRQPKPAPELPPPPPDDEPELTDLPTGAPLDVLRARLEWVRRLLASLEPRVARGEVPITQIAGLVRLELDVARRVADMTPPEPPDPAKDPHTIAARATVLQQVQRIIEAGAARTGRICFRCRQEMHEEARRG